jgi:MSHA pilin protein MshA
MRKQKGFTLIELIVVIIVLGILAAFIIPRFGELDKEARSAVVYGMEGSVRGAAALIHGVALARNATTTVNIEGENIGLTNGYPANAVELAKAIQDTAGFAVATADFRKDGASAPATCRVTYTAPTAAGDPPAIAHEVGGC